MWPLCHNVLRSRNKFDETCSGVEAILRDEAGRYTASGGRIGAGGCWEEATDQIRLLLQATQPARRMYREVGLREGWLARAGEWGFGIDQAIRPSLGSLLRFEIQGVALVLRNLTCGLQIFFSRN